MEFFGGRPLLVDLTDVYRKRNRENEERMLLEFSMPLNADNFKDAHDSIALAFQAISDPKSSITTCDIEAEFEGMRLEIYELPEHHGSKKKPAALLTSCTLRKLIVSRSKNQPEIGEGDIHLSFNTTVPYLKSLWSFAGDFYDKSVFIHFSEGQLVIPHDGDDEEEDDSQIPLIDGKAAAAGEKSGDDMPTLPAEQRAAVEQMRPAPRGPRVI